MRGLERRLVRVVLGLGICLGGWRGFWVSRGDRGYEGAYVGIQIF